MLSEGPPSPAVGQGNPTLQLGSPGTRRCLHASLAPTPRHGGMRRRVPCSCVPWINICCVFSG